MIKSTNSLIGNMNILTKVYFPRIILPLANSFKSFGLFIALSIVFLFMLYYSIIPSINILWLPLLIMFMLINAAGAGIWLSALAIQYRDIRHAILFLFNCFCMQHLLYGPFLYYRKNMDLQLHCGMDYIQWQV